MSTLNDSSCATGGFPCEAGTWIAFSASLAAGGLGLFMANFLTQKLQRAPRGTDIMNEISEQIQSGARSFLRTEYRFLTVFVALVAGALVVLYWSHPPSGQKMDGLRYMACFVCGAYLSASAGWGGMVVATNANVKTTQAALSNGLEAALDVAFTGGAVMGFLVVGLGLLGITVMLTLMASFGYGDEENRYIYAVDALSAFGFGASSIALFARVAGGIFTKAADIGADLVGKIELDIPEDDARNPAVIADNVGDNVGDNAGMGADLLESFVGSLIAAMVLANGDLAAIMLPVWVAGAGIAASAVAYFFVGLADHQDGTPHSQKQLATALNKGLMVASLLEVGLSAGICLLLFRGREDYGWKVFGCIVVGLVSGVAIGQSTEYFTSFAHWPTTSIVDAASTGPATVIIQGLGIGMMSTVPPVLILVAAILVCNFLAGQYGIAIASVGMLSTLGFTLAMDSYGPIADNAGGIAEMSGLDHRVRELTDALDALGNTTAATGKGFAIGSAVLTALSLLSAFKAKAEIDSVDIGDPVVLSGVLIGGMLPFLFAALTMLSVQKSAGAIIREVRRQFAEIPGLKDGSAKADSDRCVAIATTSAIQEMILPGLYAILSPLIVGFTIGPRALTGLLAGSIVSGMMLAIKMANAGGAWDNAKKYIEIEGARGGKGTAVHKACVVGDTVGDPFKDTSGPSLNILIKLMSIIALTIGPVIAGTEDWELWWWGMFPIGILLVGNFLVYHVFWKGQPLGIDTSIFVAGDSEEPSEESEKKSSNLSSII